MKKFLTIIFVFCALGVYSQNILVTGPKKKQTTTTTIHQSAAQKKETASSKTKQNSSLQRNSSANSSLNSNSSSSSSSVNNTSRQRILNELANDMVYVSGGAFTMGDTANYYGEERRHNVYVSSFYICKYEVTQELWQAVMVNNPSYHKGIRKPVENVSWNECKTFISKLNNLTGKVYRLPTEAEWEYACRGGKRSQGYKYSGSNTLVDVSWYDDNSGRTTHEVGLKSPNELGIYDMSGNVYEWCSDWYGTYDCRYQTNPTGPSYGHFRVRRGGCYDYPAWRCRSLSRDSDAPGYGDSSLGLRLALSEDLH